jgi:isoleucyl-tRNA synthetase
MDPKKEEEILKFWKERQVYKKVKKLCKGRKKFYFLDGPPYATGSIHLGTAWNKILKDIVIRFWRMQGWDVWDQPGYDTHGLPIENKIEKELQIKSKSDIERIGIEKFILACRDFATRHIGTMNNQFANLGVWMDWNNPYITLNNDYIEGAWHTFKIAFDSGFLYRGLYPVHVCPHCVDPNSTVLVDGGTRKMKELENCWSHNKVVSVDTTSKEINITRPLGYMKHEEDAFIVKTKTGKRLIASQDHPFWTPRGWMPLSELQTGTKTAVYNNIESPLPKITEKGKVVLNENKIKSTLEKLENLAPKDDLNIFYRLTSSSKIKIKEHISVLRKNGCSYKEILDAIENKFGIKVSKSWIAKILNTKTSTRFDFLIKDLREKDLLPLRSKSTKSFILARLLGHIFGDGSLILRIEKNRGFPLFRIVFTGKGEDLKEIQKDLDNLGYNYSDIHTVPTKSIVNGRLVDGFTTSMRCESSSLSILLISLGCPIGRKSQNLTYVPKWIKSNRKLTREFLASYFGSELQIIGQRRYGKGFESLRLYLSKDRKLEKNGIEFAEEICHLINKFGVTTGNLKVERVIVNGKDKSKITISIDCSDENLIKFTRFLGYEYCKYRKIRASHVLGYILYKKSIEKKYQKLKNTILSLRNSGIPCSKIAVKLSLPELYVRHVVYGKSKSIREAKYIETFEEWLKNATQDLKDGLVWDEIEYIKHLGKRSVCDIAVENHHNFITNGFLTHNCETAVAYNEIEYTTVTDPSVYVKFKVREDDKESHELTIPTYLLIWTTTPWTLPANTGVMAKPDADYVYVRLDDQIWILAKELLESVMQKIGSVDYKVIKTTKGKDLEGLRYLHPLADMLAFQRELKNAHRVVLSDQFVTLDTGTGLVHTAPGHGQEDYKVGLETKLPALSPVNMNGTFTKETGELAGIFVKHADKIIIDRLKERGLLVLEEKISHEYPQCWRCDSPLLLISVPQWFFKVTKIRNKLLAENKKVNWYPKWSGQRFNNWLENLGDWPISRQRYWGIPLPIWICEDCNYVKVIGSAKELKTKIKDLHRPYIDSVTLKCKCGSLMRRIPDVLDVWFDSGLASWASLGYPKNKVLFKSMWPPELNIEGPDQIRGWWNSQLITSVITFGKAPFRSILFHGFVLDAHGNKMAKSKGNIVVPEEVVHKYGRDVLRYYLVSSPPWDDFYFKWVDVDAVAKSFTVIENTFNFVKTYVTKAKGKMPASKLKPEDKWILSRLNSTAESAAEHMQNYNIHKAAVEINNFILNDFSRWYIKLIRDRVWPAYAGRDKEAAFYTLKQVTTGVAKMLAVFCPFIAEYAWQTCRMLGEKDESVHLCSWPKAEKKFINKKLEDSMSLVKEISEAVNAVRKENSLKLRWPVEKIIVESKDTQVKTAIKQFEDVIKTITNSKKIELGYGSEDLVSKDFSKGKVFVSKKILKEEALLRELLREIQEQRKKRKLVVKQKIILYLDNEKMKKFSREIKEKVSARELHFGAVDKEFGSVSLEGDTVRFKFTLIK